MLRLRARREIARSNERDPALYLHTPGTTFAWPTNLKLGLSQSARMEQRLLQSPQMIQAMQILQLNGLDLEDRVQQELVENPFLEVVEPAASGSEGADAASAAEDKRVEGMLEELERYRDLPGSRRRTGSSEDGDKKLEAMANTPDSDKSLAEDLIGELSFLDLDPRRRELAEYLLYSLDERGYLRSSLADFAREWSLPGSFHESWTSEQPPGATHTPAPSPNGSIATVQLDELADGVDAEEATTDEPTRAETTSGEAPDDDPQAGTAREDAPQAEAAAPVSLSRNGDSDEEPVGFDPPVTVPELRSILEELRHISHPGLGARDLRECLLLQIDSMGLEIPLVRAIVDHHLEDLEQNRLPRIAKATGKSIEAVKQAVEILRTFEPNPGASYGDTKSALITPDVIVEEIDGEYQVRLDRQRTPELTLSPTYRDLLQKAQKGDGVREWVKKRLESARWFIDALQQRHSTLQRISDAIFKHQRGFLERGVSAFQPLRMQEIADEVGVHISTVSRAVSGKYAQTPRGIFPLKYFFAGGTQTSSGEVASQVSIKQKIADLVAQEVGDHPLSDEEIAAQLEARDNIKIARRTVTKYRKALRIPSSNQRRQF
ncbi:MAG: RNA polymerase factor sigma-54 [Planctomycetota bacterium]